MSGEWALVLSSGMVEGVVMPVTAFAKVSFCCFGLDPLPFLSDFFASLFIGLKDALPFEVDFLMALATVFDGLEVAFGMVDGW